MRVRKGLAGAMDTQTRRFRVGRERGMAFCVLNSTRASLTTNRARWFDSRGVLPSQMVEYLITL